MMFREIENDSFVFYFYHLSSTYVLVSHSLLYTEMCVCVCVCACVFMSYFVCACIEEKSQRAESGIFS